MKFQNLFRDLKEVDKLSEKYEGEKRVLFSFDIFAPRGERFKVNQRSHTEEEEDWRFFPFFTLTHTKKKKY